MILLTPFGLLDVFVLCLGTFRLTHFLVFDELFAPIRNWFVRTNSEQTKVGLEESVPVPRGKGLQRFIGRILICYWCAGVWASGGMLALYLLFPVVGKPLAYLLCIAGCQSLLETWVQSKS